MDAVAWILSVINMLAIWKIYDRLSALEDKTKDEPEEHHPRGDVFASAELAADHTTPELQTGFQRVI